MSEPRRKRRGEGYEACDAEVEEARAELYREQAEGLRQERSEKTDCRASLRAGSQ